MMWRGYDRQWSLFSDVRYAGYPSHSVLQRSAALVLNDERACRLPIHERSLILLVVAAGVPIGCSESCLCAGALHD